MYRSKKERLRKLKESRKRACIKYRNSEVGKAKMAERRQKRKKKFPLYGIFSSMWQRCTNPKNPMFCHYGGRGIKVCDRWQSYEAFAADMGQRPSGSTLDRIDNSKDYTPENCRWATHIQQSRNTRRNIYVDYKGEKITIAELASRHNISQECLNLRLKRGFGLMEAVTRPVRKYLRKRG